MDLDGTLVRSDLLVEGVFRLLKRNPAYALLLPAWLLRGRAYLKERVAERSGLDPAMFPYEDSLLAALRERRARGARIFLVTASPRRYADLVAGHLGLFDDVLATENGVNLKGRNKLAAIRGAIGDEAFEYAGNAMADLPVWAEAERAIVVNPDPGVLPALRRRGVDSTVLADPRRDGVGRYLRALRIHQWLKNLLLFVPLALAHRIDEPGLLWNASLGFLAFCFCASSVYLLNDLLDLPTDRQHPTKRDRPVAAGTIPLGLAAGMVPALLLAAVLLALALPAAFLATLAGYYGLTLAYSLRLKHAIMLDVLVLAGLYTLRLIAGAAATMVTLSSWLLAFSMFLFLSLALVKRYSELSLHSDRNVGVAARGYRDVDLPMLAQLGTSSALVSVLVLALYINSDNVVVLYERPWLIWLVCPLLLYLLGRIWLLAQRKRLHEDPVVFLMRDARSLWVTGLAVALLWVAS